MSMTTTEYGVLNPAIWLGENGILFEVPVYQRLFTWEKPQFERLLDDLEKTGNKSHYLGIITVVKKNAGFILVDGQQRLTAIAILSSLLEKKDNEAVPEIGKRLSYSARPDDTKALKSIWKNGKRWMQEANRDIVKGELESTIRNRSMRELVLTVWDRTHPSDSPSGNKWGEIINVNALKFLVAELPPDYEKDTNLQNEYFEKMNSSGKQLEPHEVLKVRICKSDTDMQKWNAIENFGKPYSQPDDSSVEVMKPEDPPSFSEAINMTFEKSTETETLEKWRSSPISFPMFLRHVHALCQPDGKLDVETELLKLFKNRAPADDFLKTMEDYRRFLDEWIIHVSHDGSLGNNEEVEDESDFKYWVLGEEKAFATNRKSDNHDLSLFKQLEMTLFALEDDRQQWILKAFMNNRERQSVACLTDWLARYLLQNKFASEQLEKATWPEEYLVYGQHPRAQLICLDFMLWLLLKSEREYDKGLKAMVFRNLSDKEKTAISKFVPRSHRSVEHFHPQADEKNSSNVSAWSKTIATTGIRVKDVFGNLALISAGRNSEYSNLGIAGKSERIDRLVEKSAIESIKLLLMRAECKDRSGNAKDENWNPKQAQTHADKMLQVIQWGLQYFRCDRTGFNSSGVGLIVNSASIKS